MAVTGAKVVREPAVAPGAPARRPVRRAPAPVRRAVAAVRRAGSAAVAGDRPYLVVMAGVLVLTGVTLAGPIDRFLDGRDRVRILEAQADALARENTVLERRVDDLHDPEQIELRAREQLGLVRPGEVPYVVVTPEARRPQVAPADEVPAPDRRPWYRRLWEAIGELGG